MTVKNENRPGYKKTKVGWIPEGWEASCLKYLTSTSIKNGYSPICSDSPTGKWVLGLGALNGHGFDSTQVKPAPENNRQVDSCFLKSGDFLISRSNTVDKVGRVALFKGEVKNCSYPDLMMRFRVKEAVVSPEYLEGYLRSPKAVCYLQRSASGTSGSMVKINKTTVEKIPVLLPPLAEQKAIAEVLSVWDRAISNTERLIQAKEKRFKGLLQTLINPADQSGWGKARLGEIAKIKKGSQRNRDGLDDFGAYPAMNGGVGPSGYTDEWNTEANTVTISEGGNSCGFVNYVTQRFWCGGHCYALTNIRSGTEAEYLFHFLKSREPSLMRLRVGSGLPNIQKKDVDDFPVELPPLAEQKRIAETLNLAQRELDLLKKMAEKLKLQKRGLMQKLLTGEWRIGEKVEAGLARTEGNG